MPSFTINPIPEMVSQRFKYLPKFLPIIDPTCGRYCLKSLLKYWYEKKANVRYQDILLPKPANRLSDWIAYDPYDDYQHAPNLLLESYDIPTTADQWIKLLQDNGPIILRGVLGEASVSHFILLIGASSDNPQTLSFKDPLAGDVVTTEAYAGMASRIVGPLVYGRSDIMSHLLDAPAQQVLDATH